MQGKGGPGLHLEGCKAELTCVCVYVYRVSYILCDPVLACITVIPVLLLHRLPIIVEDFLCLDVSRRPVDNSSVATSPPLCVNRTSSSVAMSSAQLDNLTAQHRLTLQDAIVSCSPALIVLVTFLY